MHCIIYIYIISSPKLNTKYIDVNIYIYKNMYINIYLHDLGVNDQGYPAPRLRGPKCSYRDEATLGCPERRRDKQRLD